MGISWHELFGHLLELYLTPVGIKVLTEVPVLSRPPESDLLLLRHDGPATPEQKSRLCDGLRDSDAGHILIEFKYSESVGEVAVGKAVGYHHFYGESKELKKHQLGTFIISSRTPSSRFIRESGYTWAQEGVMQASHPILQPIRIISLNDLPNTPHNAVFKVFASKRKQISAGFDRIMEADLVSLSQELGKRFFALYRAITEKEPTMTSKTIDDFERIGLALAKQYWRSLPAEERLQGLSAEERLHNLSAEERLSNLSVEERLGNLSEEEIVRALEARRNGANP